MEVEETKESFDNFFNEINKDLYKGYSKKFVEYLNNTLGDKWNFHILFKNESYIPFTLLGTNENIKNLINLSKNNYYIKKRDGSYGRQITITSTPLNFFKQYGLIDNNYIIQREITSDTYKNRKYDYRIYLLIYKKNNKIYYGYYNKYVIRNSFKEMSDNNDKFSKITNHHIYSLQELDEYFYILSDDFEKNHKNKINLLNERIINKIKLLETDFFNLLENNQFRILGVDYLVEKLTNKIYLLEINITPGVYYENKIQDFFIKYNNFHKKMIIELNDILSLNKQDNNWNIYI